jgi:hypothetical protein
MLQLAIENPPVFLKSFKILLKEQRLGAHGFDAEDANATNVCSKSGDIQYLNSDILRHWLS